MKIIKIGMDKLKQINKLQDLVILNIKLVLL